MEPPFLEIIQNLSGHGHGQQALGGPCLRRRGLQDDLQRFFITSTILWSCNFCAVQKNLQILFKRNKKFCILVHSPYQHDLYGHYTVSEVKMLSNNSRVLAKEISKIIHSNIYFWKKVLLETVHQQVLYKIVFGLHGKILIAGECTGVALRISELFRWEKPSETSEFNHSLSTANPRPVYTHISLCVHLCNI